MSNKISTLIRILQAKVRISHLIVENGAKIMTAWAALTRTDRQGARWVAELALMHEIEKMIPNAAYTINRCCDVRISGNARDTAGEKVGIDRVALKIPRRPLSRYRHGPGP
jgi:hypothetical protein